MPEDARLAPESFQVVSDLAQLKVFTDPRKTRLLRLLQHRESTIDELTQSVGESRDLVEEHVRVLHDVSLVRVVGDRFGAHGLEEVFRATARVYSLRPEPGHEGIASAAINPTNLIGAHLSSVSEEVLRSAEQWPDQRANYESRRRRIPYDKAMEFNDKLVGLINDYWGAPEDHVEDDPTSPLLSFVGFWYRYPDKDE
jgi:predicted ArsR family transcriptional regulator